MMKLRRLPAWIFIVLSVSACGKDDITVYRVAKQPQTAAHEPGAQMLRGIMDASQEAVEESAAGKSGVRWTKPKGWTESPASGMRKATFNTGPDDKGAEIAVVALSGDAGGTLSNINRWRDQLGLGPIEEAQLDASVELIKSPAGEILLADITSAGAAPRKRMAVAMIRVGGMTWFFKMMGVEDVVGRAQPEFRKFLAGLKS